MSSPTPDTLYYEGDRYCIIRRGDGGLFDPAQFGITTDMLHTGCYRGYLCTYEVAVGGLFLAALEIQAKRGGVYPLINGAPPAFEDECTPNFTPPASYHGIDLEMAYTGSLLLGADLDYSFSFSSLVRPDWMWRKMLALELVDGRVQTVKDRSEEMAKLRAKKPKPVFSPRGECLNADELCRMDIPQS